MIASGLHRHGQLVRAAEGSDEQRHQQRHHGLGALKEVAGIKIRASCGLRLHDLVGLFQQRRDKAQRDGHHHRHFMHGEVNRLEGLEQPLQRIGQRHGRGRQRQQRRAQQQEDQAQRHKHGKFNAFPINFQDAPFHQRMFTAGEEDVEHQRHDDDEQYRLERTHHVLNLQVRQRNGQSQIDRKNQITQESFYQKNQRDIGDHQQHLNARIHAVDHRAAGAELPERNVFKHGLHLPARRRAPFPYRPWYEYCPADRSRAH